MRKYATQTSPTAGPRNNILTGKTFLQIAKHRYGAPAHIVLCCYCLLYQVILTVSLLVGGSAVFSILTGVDRNALCFLFPIGVVSMSRHWYV